MLNGFLLRNVYTKTLRDMLRPLLWWAGGLGLLMLWMVTLFPSISEAWGGFADILDVMPASFRLIIGEATNFSTLEGYLSLELFGFFLPGLTIAFAVTFGGSLISRQEEDGALDLLLSNPLPRWQLMLEKFAALVTFTVLVLAAGFAGLLLGGAIAGIPVAVTPILEGTLSVLAITLFFGTLALAITGMVKGRGLAVGVTAALAAGTYFLNALQPMTDLPEWVRYLSPWYYYKGDTVLTDGIQWGHFGLLMGLTVVFIAVGTLVFQQRDLGA